MPPRAAASKATVSTIPPSRHFLHIHSSRIRGLRSWGADLTPRLRGNLIPICGVRVRVWSIPACAGEPLTRLELIYSFVVRLGFSLLPSLTSCARVTSP